MLKVLFPGHFNVRRPSYTCYHLCRAITTADFPVEITVPSYARVSNPDIMRPSLPWPVGRILGKVNAGWLKGWTEAHFLKSVSASDTVYIWGKVQAGLVAALKDKGATIFQEKINSLDAASREVLDGVYRRLGKRPAHRLSDELIESELAQLRMVDYVFVANPVAAAQYGRFGIDPGKLIQSSYGWDKSRFTGPRPGRPEADRSGADGSGSDGSGADGPGTFTVAFVGVADIHKGANLLLEAWARAGIDGRLVFGGPVGKDVMADCADLLARPDVTVTGWTDEIEAIYQSADVFAFPSHDEGGPLVTYEAMGCGLPVIVSPIGAGAIARHGNDGFIVDPFDLEGWVDALRRLASDPDLRRSMGDAARQRAQDFTWDKVGARRRQAILERAR